MKKFLHFIHWRYLKQHYHEWKKDLSHKEALQKFLHTKNGKLAVIIIIAAMIPMTVLSLQQVQNIHPEAAGEPPCDGSAGMKADPIEQTKGQPITFSFTDGSLAKNEDNGFGNGVFPDSDPKKCAQDGNNITCTARGTGTSSVPLSKHTWTSPSGQKCEYRVMFANLGPTATRKPTQPPPPPGGFCEGTIKSECTFDNKPRLQLSWNLRGPNTGCSVEVYKDGAKVATMSTKCESKSAEHLENIQNGGTYNLMLKNGGTCDKNAGAVTANCGGGNPTQPPAGNGTPTATPKPGQATNTPAPNATNTPVPTTPGGGKPNAKCEVHLNNQTTCTSSNKIRLTGDWEMNYNDPSTCKVTLLEGSDEKGTATGCKNNAWNSSNGIEADKLYTLQIESDLCQASSPSVTAKACTSPSQTPAQQGTQVQALWYSLEELLNL